MDTAEAAPSAVAQRPCARLPVLPGNRRRSGAAGPEDPVPAGRAGVVRGRQGAGPAGRRPPRSRYARHMRLVVVGAGLAGLATATFAARAHPELDVIVLEAGDRAGGRLRTDVVDGYVLDAGPIAFPAGAADALDLVRVAGLAERLRPARPEAARRYLYVDGGLRPWPATPADWLRSDLLSPPAKLRAAGEAWLGRRARREETITAFVGRHFGHEAARALAGFLAVVAAGDARELSLDALYPRLRQLEASHGSLLRALAAERRQRPRGESDTAHALAGGMAALADRLAATLGARLRTGVRATGLADHGRPGDGPMVLRVAGAAGPAQVEADALVLALPAHAAADLLAESAPEATAALAAIRYADVAIASFGFDRIDVPTVLDGSGAWVPRGQGVRALEVQWPSAAFPDRAPPGKVVLRVLAGGTLDPGFVALDDDAAIAAARRDLERTVGVVAEPEAVALVRWPRGLPQYVLGHAARVAAARTAAAQRWPRLALVGDYLSGLGVHDVVREARAAALRLTGVPRVP